MHRKQKLRNEKGKIKMVKIIRIKTKIRTKRQLKYVIK